MYSTFRVLGVVSAVEEIGRGIEEYRPDSLFLDLDLDSGAIPEMLGLLDSRVKIVLLASDEEFALGAFEAGVLDCLSKPVSEERLHLTAMRILAHHRAGNELLSPMPPSDHQTDMGSHFLMPTAQRGKHAGWVSCCQIVWIQGEQNYTRVQLYGG
jgi:DNA-binding LytR/AlgR family response regulator